MIRKNGVELRTVEDWYAHAPPKSPTHWVDGRSAKEAAVAWLSGGSAMPREVQSVLEAHAAFGPLLTWQAEPEAKLAFDSFRGEPRNSDLVVHVKDLHGSFVLAVEAKADEPFGETVADALSNALERRIERPNSKGLARLEHLATRLFIPKAAGQPPLGTLRYQLLTACAGALAESERAGASRCVMLVHEFVSDKTDDKNHQRNSGDLLHFVQRLSSCASAKLERPGGMLGPFRTPGWPDIDLFVAKAVRVLRPTAKEML